MKRRDFIASACLAVAAASLPAPAKPVEPYFSLDGFSKLDDSDAPRGFFDPITGSFVQLERWLVVATLSGERLRLNPEWCRAPYEIEVWNKGGRLVCLAKDLRPVS